MANPLRIEPVESGRPRHGVFGIGAASDSPFAVAYGHNPDADPSPVGYHESMLEHKLSVDARTGMARLSLEVSRYPDSAKESESPFVVLSIQGDELDAGGICTSKNSPDGQGAVSFAIPRRETLGAMADALRYLADRSEAVGLLAGLPEDHYGAMYAANRAANTPAKDAALAAVVAVRSVLDRRIPDEAIRQKARNWSVMRERGCACANCERLRSEPFRCDTCGYRGVPVVPRCRCVDQWNEDMQETQSFLAELRSRRVGSTVTGYGSELTLADVHRNIGCLLERKPAGECTNREEAYDDCLHGHVECPVCGGPGEPFGDDIIDPWAIIREIRAALEALAPSVTSEDGASPARGVYQCRNRVGGKEAFYAVDESGEIVDIRVVRESEDRDVVIAELAQLAHPMEGAAVEPVDADPEVEGEDDKESSATPASERTLVYVADVPFKITDDGMQVLEPHFVAKSEARQVFTHGDESFVMLLEVPALSGHGADAVDRDARDRGLRLVTSLREGRAFSRGEELTELNGEFLRALAEIRAGRGAWDWYRFRDGDGTIHSGLYRDPARNSHQSLARLQYQYFDRLSDRGVISYSVMDGMPDAVFADNERQFVDRPGVFATHGFSAVDQLDIDLALGRFVSKRDGKETYPVDIRIHVIGDLTLQAIAADFVTGLWERYGDKD